MPHDPVRSFENAFRAWLEVPYARAFWKGRVAMYAILKALGVGEGDEVVVPGYTCVMDINPIKYLGARPVYVDVDPLTYNARPEAIEARVGPRTRLIVAQHTYGVPCEMDAILDVGNRRGIPVVEDCCLALGSRYRGQPCGTFGVAAYWSFQWNKSMTTGLGGMATSTDAGLARAIDEVCDQELKPPSRKAQAMLGAQRLVHRALIYPRSTALAASVFRRLSRRGLLVGSSSADEFNPRMPESFFTGMGAGQARAGLSRLRRLEANLGHRRRMKRRYDELLADAGWPSWELPAHLDPVLVRYPVRVADKERAVAEAPGRQVELGTWFECPLHPAETPLRLYDYQPGLCPTAEQACREVVNLPLHPRAGDATARRSIDFVRAIGPPPCPIAVTV